MKLTLTEQELGHLWPGEWHRRFETALETTCIYCSTQQPYRRYEGYYDRRQVWHVHATGTVLPRDHYLVTGALAPESIDIEVTPPPEYVPLEPNCVQAPA